jgi:hypothetical protein
LYQDYQYPDAEFLFEVNGLGGPMMPYRFYFTKEDNIDTVADFYREQLPDFTLEIDEVEEGYRHLMLVRTESVLDRLGEVKDPMELPQRARELEGKLVGVEVVHASDDVSISRLRVARHAYQRADEIPEDAVIIVLEYFKNIYG